MAIHGFPGGVISATAPTISPSGASGVWTLDDQLQNSANWPVTPVLVDRSLRFRRSASAYLSRTPSTTTNRRTWTFSAWIKRGQLGNIIFPIFTAGAQAQIRFEDDNGSLRIYGNSGALNITTSQKFRDPSSWYHFVFVLDTTQATDTNRFKIYVNGVQLTNSGTYPAQNSEFNWNTNSTSHNIGGLTSESLYFDGYMTEVNFIDGQALTPNYFGATNASTGAWQPATYRGTYGTNGFYLPTNVQGYGLDYLLVAGGGGGGYDIGGGGGGGGVLYNASFPVQSGVTYIVTVGSGGAKATSAQARGSSGGNSVFASSIAIGGGGGGGRVGGVQAGGSGGSGGGGSGDGGGSGSGTSGQGNSGGSGNPSYSPGAGGGGAGTSGGNTGASETSPGSGGSGTSSSITGSSVIYAGGGGGGYNATSNGGSGGGGRGGGGPVVGTGSNATDGTANLGGGGGGGGNGNGSSENGGNGGSGVVILRILTSQYTGVTTGSPTVTTDGSYTVVKYTSSGSYTA